METKIDSRPNNVAININKYIAKYDFDIAHKIQSKELLPVADEED